MLIFDILADTGAGLERVTIATTAQEAETTTAALAAAGARGITVKMRRI